MKDEWFDFEGYCEVINNIEILLIFFFLLHDKLILILRVQGDE